jgi:hypothetical protein
MNVKHFSFLRITDLCDYCEKGRHLREKISRIMREDDLHFNENSMIADLKNHYKQQLLNFTNQIAEQIPTADESNELQRNLERTKDIITDLGDMQAIVFHKNVAKSQRQAYVEHQSPIFLRNKLMIEVDYKEKIKIGLSPRQISKEFYEQQQRSFLST